MAKVSKKELIIQHSRKLFSELGYELTCLESVAKECSITKPAIYYHFKDKATLYKAVVSPEFTALEKRIEESTQRGSAVERLRSYIHTFGEFLISNPDFSAIFAREIANGSRTIPDECIEQLSRSIKQLVNILYTGVQEGIFKEESAFLVQMMIVTPLISYHTTKPLREKIAKFAQNETITLDPQFRNITESLSEKIIKGLQC